MRTILLAAALLLTSTLAFAKTVFDIPVEHYGALPEKSLVSLSRSGDLIAYRDTSGGDDKVVVLNLSTGKHVTSLALGEVKPNSLRFVDDNYLILVVSDNKRLYRVRGRHDVSAAYSINLKTGDLHQLLTPGYGIHSSQTNVGRIIAASKDGRYVYMPAYADDGRYHLYRVDLEKRRRPVAHQKGTPDTINFFMNRDREVVARERFDSKRDEHKIQVRRDGKWKTIFEEETAWIYRSYAGLTPDEEHLVMFAVLGDTNHTAYYAMRLSDGHVGEPMFSSSEKSVVGAFQTDTSEVEGVIYSGFKPDYEFFDKKLMARFKGISQALPNNIFTIVSATPDWSKIVLLMEGEQSSGDYILYENGSLDLLTMSRPGIPREAVASVKSDGFVARDGLSIPTLLTTPVNASEGPLPTILLPHGGPESHDQMGFYWLSQYFSNQGYLVIQPQFRGSTGFGVDHVLKGRGEWGKKMQDDLTDAVAAYAERGLVDEDRVCIVGISYGGYAALAGATFTPDLYKCAISVNGIGDVYDMLQADKRDYGSRSGVVAYWEDVLGNHETPSRKALRKISPMQFVEQVKAPVLLIHGQHDSIVKVDQSRDMHKALKSAEKDVTYVELKAGDHNMSKGENRIKALVAIDSFIKEHL
ncbi:prolyl oligopeptidase [Paraferrimonas sedimenticola]|uniref:Prolyl oligopeptidase n=2 Tax=Paraferrimonas sedimenticola TaxID=375674 RepID=A0AA37RZ91_9GAMM|nr:prolyl oligopeptidase [Paraferrimonas sedimenticola]